MRALQRATLAPAYCPRRESELFGDPWAAAIPLMLVQLLSVPCSTWNRAGTPTTAFRRQPSLEAKERPGNYVAIQDPPRGSMNLPCSLLQPPTSVTPRATDLTCVGPLSRPYAPIHHPIPQPGFPKRGKLRVQGGHDELHGLRANFVDQTS